MQITRQTIFYSASNNINCSKEQALSYFSKLTEINIDRFAAGKCEHLAEYCFGGNEGLLVAGADFHAASLPEDICAAIAWLLNATSNEYLDITFSVCSPIFSIASHRGGTLRVFRDGSTLTARANF